MNTTVADAQLMLVVTNPKHHTHRVSDTGAGCLGILAPESDVARPAVMGSSR